MEETIGDLERLVKNGHGKAVMDELRRCGLNKRALNDMLSLSEIDKLTGLNQGPRENVVGILIAQNRKAKPVTVSKISTALKCADPICISCTRLSQGPWLGVPIKIWYDSESQLKNRRASRLTGFPVGGAV